MSNYTEIPRLNSYQYTPILKADYIQWHAVQSCGNYVPQDSLKQIKIPIGVKVSM